MTATNESVPVLRDGRAVGYLRVFHVKAKLAGVVRWEHDIVAQFEEDAETIAREFILTQEGLDDLAKERLTFTSERAQGLNESYGWVIGVR